MRYICAIYLYSYTVCIQSVYTCIQHAEMRQRERERERNKSKSNEAKVMCANESRLLI